MAKTSPNKAHVMGGKLRNRRNGANATNVANDVSRAASRASRASSKSRKSKTAQSNSELSLQCAQLCRSVAHSLLFTTQESVCRGGLGRIHDLVRGEIVDFTPNDLARLPMVSQCSQDDLLNVTFSNGAQIKGPRLAPGKGHTYTTFLDILNANDVVVRTTDDGLLVMMVLMQMDKNGVREDEVTQLAFSLKDKPQFVWKDETRSLPRKDAAGNPERMVGVKLINHRDVEVNLAKQKKWTEATSAAHDLRWMRMSQTSVSSRTDVTEDAVISNTPVKGGDVDAWKAQLVTSAEALGADMDEAAAPLSSGAQDDAVMPHLPLEGGTVDAVHAPVVHPPGVFGGGLEDEMDLPWVPSTLDPTAFSLLSSLEDDLLEVEADIKEWAALLPDDWLESRGCLRPHGEPCLPPSQDGGVRGAWAVPAVSYSDGEFLKRQRFESAERVDMVTSQPAFAVAPPAPYDDESSESAALFFAFNVSRTHVLPRF